MRSLILLSAAFVASAGAAQAQTPSSGQAAGLRYLGWAGKPAAAPPAAEAAPAASRAVPAASSRPAPRIIPHGGVSTAARANGLTPAEAWLRPQPAPPSESPPSESPPSEPRQPEPQPAPSTADPMAPRPDAPVFRSAQPAPASPPSSAPAAGGSRYYSVHRAFGRRPDPIATPAPVYLDALPVELNQAPQSADLAEPPAAPTVLRDANGRIRPAAPVPGDDVS